MSDQAALIIGLRRTGRSLHEIAAELDVPVSLIERTLRNAGNRICEQTGKRSFSSERQARRATKTASNKIRVYRCEHGAHWHVTSQAQPDFYQPVDRRRWKGWEG